MKVLVLIASVLVQVAGPVSVAGHQPDVTSQGLEAVHALMVNPGAVSEDPADTLSGFPIVEVYLPPDIVAQCKAVIFSPANEYLRNSVMTLLKTKHVADAEEWTRSVLMALCANDMPLTPEYISLVFAIIEKESSFVAHALLPNQPEGFRKLTHRLIDDIFSGDSTALEKVFGKQLGVKLAQSVIVLAKNIGLLSGERVRWKFDELYGRFGWHRIITEWDIENVLSEDILSISEEATPLGLSVKAFLAYSPDVEQRLRSHSFLNTVGPMQVSARRMSSLAQSDFQELTEDDIRRLLYTIEGGVYFGTMNLKRFVNIYVHEGLLNPEAVGFIAADYTASLYASRNSAFIQQIGVLVDTSFPADATLGSQVVKAALQRLVKEINGLEGGASGKSGINSSPYLDNVEDIAKLSRKKELERSAIYHLVRKHYMYLTSHEPEYAAIPRIYHYSPKNGIYAIATVARRTREVFSENCLMLGCSAWGKSLDAGTNANSSLKSGC